MAELAQMHCSPLKAGTATLTETEISRLTADLPGWQVFIKDGEPRLEKIYKFQDYPQAIAFANQVANAAIIEDHHPVILLEYGKVTVTWWSHIIHGLHQNDFIMAARTEQLFERAM
jgi:4a-hydroxytetrahydrobiopterin dehydratase